MTLCCVQQLYRCSQPHLSLLYCLLVGGAGCTKFRVSRSWNELEIWVSDRAWTNSFCTLASLGAYEDFMPGIEYDVLGGI